MAATRKRAKRKLHPAFRANIGKFGGKKAPPFKKGNKARRKTRKK